MSSGQRVLVAGGTGFLGRHLAAALLAAGHSVRVLGRSFAPISDLLAAGVEAFPADLRDAAAVARACAGVEVVFHAAALSAPWGRPADFYASNVVGTENVLAGCKQAGVARLVAVSSPSVTFSGYDVVAGDEAAAYPQRWLSPYSHSKKIAEDRLNAAHRAGLPTVIIRPKAIFGPGDTALLPRLISAAQAGRLRQFGDGRNQVDLTYVDNVVHALILAQHSPQAPGNTYLITNAEHPRLWDIIRQALAWFDLRLPARPVSLGTALALARAMEWRARLTGHEPLLTRYSVAILARHQTYTIDAAHADLGYAPLVSVAEGVQRTLQALRPRASGGLL